MNVTHLQVQTAWICAPILTDLSEYCRSQILIMFIVFRVEQWQTTGTTTCGSHVHRAWRGRQGKPAVRPPGWSSLPWRWSICELLHTSKIMTQRIINVYFKIMFFLS